MAVSIDDLDTAIAALIAKDKLDYTEGDIEIRGSDHLNALIRARESLLAHPEIELETIAFDFDINAMGRDNTQVEP